MTNTQCAICSKPLSGGLDTYGATDMPMCCDCWWEDMELPKRELEYEREVKATMGTASLFIKTLLGGA